MATDTVTVVGGGLAGSECALQLAARGVPVRLFEMRPQTMSPAHSTGGFAELVCSNSLKSTRPDSAAGLLKAELRRMGSVLLSCADEAAVPAGGALAVDRDRFSALVGERIAAEPLIEVVREELTEIPEGPVVIAAGPLCSPALSDRLLELVGGEALSFFDAAAPIVDAATLDMDVLFRQSRYDEAGRGDYLNAPMDRDEYEAFIDDLVTAERVVQHDFDKGGLFQACQPAEEVARTGRDALRFGAMKPVGLTDPRTGRRPWAALQLRAENADGTAYNLVGFQTNLTFGEQKRIFRMIPGLEGAEFFRFGVMHRNTFLDSPHVLDRTFAVPGTRVRLAGQITGTEGYTEAIASGLLAALNTYADLTGAEPVSLPATGALGSLVAYATDPATEGYQPMHVNFGLVPPLADGRRRGKRERYAAYAERAERDLEAYLATRPELFDGCRRDG
ncbi:methylenetetrahydrofolate--tRNA-(uracil(54)-C(5))-methyltransferase (FADH(2)-oxidizing) TrmFO [Enorma burkinafasonensis]|uniref:methylenetetrahydrofolate--tRNA-(uracil(54)- C(5))-methyltransferase (FADH(2)-oxidizing) TrmFO n=1 Tax=Enorma burkinafasonensis TaxID=2590867 RepID=UPI0026EF7E32|nr:methylenetetrahydrofolate--tRNA-(uracil(54)-C(5))-methyltransferase (FADH(2)-oxidizing) TrmFO [Enorma burkinafasonensis]MCI7730777.1 methylenetetrahydrofolate--tRNA-(uracil(54)-C(5))-methyltransferase (FADH(2)-oxidizing) TrmFO [Enorma burkinafasonensis]